MKKYILLLASLVLSTAQAKEPNPTLSWNKQYGIKQLTSSDKNGLATGLYYLMKEKGNEKTTPFRVSQFYEIANGTCHYTCKNAFQKVFDKTVVASHKHGDKKKEKVWVDSVYPYYKHVVNSLSDEEMTISFGADRGKRLPETHFELDRVLNPRPARMKTVFKVHSPTFSLHIQM